MKKQYILIGLAVFLVVIFLLFCIVWTLFGIFSDSESQRAALAEPSSAEEWGTMAITEAPQTSLQSPVPAPSEAPANSIPVSLPPTAAPASEPVPTVPAVISVAPAAPTEAPLPESTSTPVEAVLPSPTIPAPEPEETDPTLEALLRQELDTCSGTWSLYFRRLDTGETISIGDGSMVAASLIKLYVAGAYCDAVEAGSLPDAYRSDLNIMLSQSSNEACNRIIDALGSGDTAAGMEAVNRFSASIGAEHSVLNRKMLQSGPENYTTTSDCGMVLEALLNGTFVTAEVSAELLGYLEQQERTHKIPAGVPAGTRTANKTGELSSVENDAAIIWSPACTYILCIMSEDVPSAGSAQSNIVGLSKMVYDYLNP